MERNESKENRHIEMLRSQIDLLSRLHATQELVRKAVLKREWEDFEALILRLNGYSEDYARLERERAEEYKALGIGLGSRNFYQSVFKFPEKERRELVSLHRKAKLEALRVKLSNDSLSAYVEQAKQSISSILHAAFPDRRGQIYSNKGKKVESEMRSLVLNRTF